MAVESLCDSWWNGLIKLRQCHHESEAFIWVLSFGFFRYQDGLAVPNTFVEEWMSSNYRQCRREKTNFLIHMLQWGNCFTRLDWSIAFALLFWMRVKQLAGSLGGSDAADLNP
jgi:hypothetical protein